MNVNRKIVLAAVRKAIQPMKISHLSKRQCQCQLKMKFL